MKAREKRNLYLQLFAIPAVVLIAVYLYYPIVDNLFFSLFDIKNFNFDRRVFVGLGNYVRLVSEDATFRRAMINTVLMTAGTLFIQLPIAFFLGNALVNHMRKRHRRTEEWLLILLFIPILLPTPVYAKAWRLFFTGSHGAGQGPIEWIVGRLGIERQLTSLLHTQTVLLLGEVNAAFWVVLAVQTWARIGFNLLIYRSAILTIPGEIYESAELDGAGPWSKLFHVTMPLTRHVISMTFTLAILGVFQLFDTVWMMTERGGPLNTTHVLATYMYSRAFEDLRAGYGAAIAMTILVVSLGLSFAQRRMFQEAA